jgi:hypothetical protein
MSQTVLAPGRIFSRISMVWETPMIVGMYRFLGTLHGPVDSFSKPRMVKIFEPSCSWEVTHHQAPMFRLVFHFIFLHTHSGHGLLDYLISGYVEEIEPNSDRYAYGGWGLSEPAHIIRRDPFEF